MNKQRSIYKFIENEELFLQNIKNISLNFYKSDKIFDNITKTCYTILPLLLKTIEYDNSTAFFYITREFGVGIKKTKCENLIRMVIHNDAKNIMKRLITEVGVDLKQGDNLAYRLSCFYMKKNGGNEMYDLIILHGGLQNYEKSLLKFKSNVSKTFIKY